MKTQFRLRQGRYSLLLAVLYFFSGFSLIGQELSISARLDRAEIAIGEQALLTLKIRTEDLEHTILLIPPDSALHRAEALSFSITDTVAVGDKINEITAEMVITSFDSTLVVIPAFGVQLGAKREFADPLYLKVTVPEVDLSQPEKFYPTKRSWFLPYTLWEIVRMLLPWGGGVALLVGLWILVHYLRKRAKAKPKKLAVSKEKMFSPFDTLCQSLDQISLSLDDRTFYTRLDLTFREFLASTLLPNALEMSATQLSHAFRRDKQILAMKEENPMALLLDRMNLAKFAKEAYSLQQKEHDLKKIRHIAAEISAPKDGYNVTTQEEN